MHAAGGLLRHGRRSAGWPRCVEAHLQCLGPAVEFVAPASASPHPPVRLRKGRARTPSGTGRPQRCKHYTTAGRRRRRGAGRRGGRGANGSSKRARLSDRNVRAGPHFQLEPSQFEPVVSSFSVTRITLVGEPVRDGARLMAILAARSAIPRCFASQQQYASTAQVPPRCRGCLGQAPGPLERSKTQERSAKLVRKHYYYSTCTCLHASTCARMRARPQCMLRKREVASSQLQFRIWSAKSTESEKVNIRVQL